MKRSETKLLRHTLVHAVTRYDAKQSRKRGWNPYALPQYLERVEAIVEDVEAGADPAAAIQAGFLGTLATACLKAAKLKPVDSKPSSAWSYVPESQR